MSDFSFEKHNDRFNTNSVKWDFIKQNNLPQNTLPLWVADMDFPTVPEVISGLTDLAKTGVWGYSFPSDKYYQAVIDWQKKRHNWIINKEWLVITPGVVPAINIAIKTFSEKGDAILIQEPVYHPFRMQIETLARKTISCDLAEHHTNFEINFNQFEQTIINNKIKLYILCSPHNPVGRVWTKKELLQLGDICLKHDVLIIADEIHHDLIMPDYQHHVLAGLKPDFAEITITCTAPSKTFNLAGLSISNIIIPNQKLREKFEHKSSQSCWPHPSPFSLRATEIALTKGDTWLDELLIHIKKQYERLARTIEEKSLPFSLSPLQGTYLAWLDCREISLDPSKLDQIFLEQAGLWFNNGSMFGKSGQGFMRINLACATELFDQVLERLVTVCNNLC